MTTLWSAGRYESVAERIEEIAVRTVETAHRRRSLAGIQLVDLACGTGTAALAAADRGAAVTGVDLTPELLEVGAAKAAAAGRSIAWVSADAADTGLPTESFDAAVSNMGIIFVDPDRQVAELCRLLRPGGVVAFSSWVRSDTNPLYDPIVAVLGVPPGTGFSPDQWGDAQLARQRLSAGFDDIAFETGLHGWEFDSVDQAMAFVTRESPLHVAVFERAGAAQREQLIDGFDSAFSGHVEGTGQVRFGAPYAVITARRRQPGPDIVPLGVDAPHCAW